MSDFVQKVRQKVAENPSVMLMTLAVELGRPEGDLVAALPEDMRVQGRKEDFAAIWEAMTQWEKCTFLAVNNGCVVEVEGWLPKGTFGHGMFNLAHGENALSGHIFRTGWKKYGLCPSLSSTKKATLCSFLTPKAR